MTIGNVRVGAPGRTRTCDLVIRSDLLCPAELRRQRGAKGIFRRYWQTGCEHAPFDVVGYRDGAFVRVQVKYRTLSSTGTIEVRPLDNEEVDVVCIYCPDTGACYYVDPKQFARSVSLRVTPSRNRQERNVLQAERFRAVPAAV